MNEKTKEYYLAHPDEYWKDNPDKRVLADKMKEIYLRTEDKLQLCKEAAAWIKTKPFLMKPEEINGPEAQRHRRRSFYSCEEKGNETADKHAWQKHYSSQSWHRVLVNFPLVWYVVNAVFLAKVKHDGNCYESACACCN